jgi:hypothetical protein
MCTPGIAGIGDCNVLGSDGDGTLNTVLKQVLSVRICTCLADMATATCLVTGTAATEQSEKLNTLPVQALTLHTVRALQIWRLQRTW